MQNKSLMHPAHSQRRIISISIGILSALLLVSCGGGGSSDPSATAQSADDATKTIQGASGSTTVPGTWTGRAPKMEVINGITVPPEPAPAINNATLAGVDVNNNGVRDDVERMIAMQVNHQQDFTKAISLAKAYQKIITSNSIETRSQALVLYKAIFCIDNTPGDISIALRSMSNKSIVNAATNTGQRLLALSKFNAKLGHVAAGEVNCGN